MKKTVFAILAICVCALAFASCKKEPNIVNPPENPTPNNQGTEYTEEIPAPEYTIKTEPLTDTVSAKDSGELIFTKTVERVRVTAKHNAYIDAARKISNTMKNASDRNETQADALKNNALASFTGDDMIGLPWSLETTFEAISSEGKVVSIVEHIYQSTGAAHPMRIDFSYNFDAQTGNQLSLGDFFPIGDDKKTPEITALFRSKLEEKYPGAVQESFIQTNLIEMAVDTWIFTENGMKIWYNEQEIAPHAAGKLEIELTRDELPEAALKYLD